MAAVLDIPTAQIEGVTPWSSGNDGHSGLVVGFAVASWRMAAESRPPLFTVDMVVSNS